MKIEDIREEGRVSLPVLIRKCDTGKTQKNTPYLSLTLQDATGELDARFWNLTEEQAKQYKAGDIVQAVGDIIYHRNAAQLRVRRLVPIEDADVAEFVQGAPLSRQEMEEQVAALLDSLQNETIREVTRKALEANSPGYYTYPAAVRNHHTYAGGLAYHSLAMARAGEALLPLYPWLDRDLLIAGILLHDLGKVEEYTRPVLPEYSVKGNLIGHISMANNDIDRAAVELGVQDSEDVMLLKHMVLSHHGRMEYGSPVVPMIPEAEMLQLIDNLDSRMYMMKHQLDATVPGTFGPRVFALENRMLYRRSEPQDEAESEETASEE